MISAKHSVTVVSGGEAYPIESRKNSRIPNVVIPTLGRDVRILYDLISLISLIRLLKNERPDLVSGHSSKSGLLAALACKICKIPYVYTAHSWAFLQSSSNFANWCYLHVWRLCKHCLQHVICVCHHDREIALSVGLCSPDKISTIHNSLHDKPFDRKSSSSDETKVRIVSIGRLAPPKDFQCLIRAIGLDNHLYLDIIGDGPERGSLEALVSQLSLDSRISFLGEKRESRSWIKKYDIVALSSKSEGLPYVLLESMRAGLPAVASDVGGIREAVSDEETGFLVESGNSDLFSKKLCELKNDSVMRKKMGVAARSRFLRNFQFPDMYLVTDRLYKKVVATSVRRN
jgi:glycosyltransferase involved in cell wall biosynthesis